MKHRGFFLAVAILLLTAGPALAAPGNLAAFGTLVVVYLGYAMLAATVIGWGLLGAVVWTDRVLMAGRALVQKPFASWFLGLSGGVALLLLLAVAEKVRPAALVFFLCFVVYVGLLLLGLPALMGRLGQGVLQLDHREASPLRQVLLGGLLLALAGGLPLLGIILLVMALVTAAGAAMLSFVMPPPDHPNTRELPVEAVAD